MHDFEKLGVFYLGRPYDLDKKTTVDTPLLYDSKDLTTHALCVGMTGSGKTGLCVALLEEAAIDGIPALIIDPKGDLGNLLLTFPELRPEDFKPWLDPADATRKGLTPDELAKQTAKQWSEGLAAWEQNGDRIRRYRDAVDISIYTPGGTAGLPLTVLRSFNAPPPVVRDDNDAMRERVQAAVSGLLALLGVAGDPLRSREHILVATILDRAWREGTDVDLGSLIRGIQQPSFDKVGYLDLESFYPAKERFELAMALNNLLASPGFQTWMTGDPLDIGRLLYTPEGKPRLTILSIAHLSDAERMFFVTIVLNEVISWMRSQSGTSSLRALLYMDEVFGYFPPTAEPPSKRPMLTLLKQARAYGLGVVLATQNPVDLDYKGLSNCGTWLLGRLQTERDKARVLDGLEGASTAAGATFDRARTETILSSLGNRVFLMNNVHDDGPVVFQSRWALSFLRGPLSREQVSGLMAERKKAGGGAARVSAAVASASSSAGASPTGPASAGETRRQPEAAAAPAPKPVNMAASRPVLPPDVPEMFIACGAAGGSGAAIIYRPAILGSGRVHYVSAKEVLDEWRDVHLLAAIDDDRLDGADAVPAAMWDEADELNSGVPPMASGPQPGAPFASLPGDMAQAKRYAAFSKALKEKLYRSQRFRVWRCAALKLTSRPSEVEADFKARVAQAARERRDLEVEKLRAKYGPKLQTLQDQLRRAQQAQEKQKSQASESTMSAMLSMGSTVIGAIFGRKLASAANANRAATSMRKAARIGSEKQDVAAAEANVKATEAKLAEMDAEFQAETAELQTKFEPTALEVEELAIQPRKTDISIGRVALCWTPWTTDAAGLPQKAW